MYLKAPKLPVLLLVQVSSTELLGASHKHGVEMRGRGPVLEPSLWAARGKGETSAPASPLWVPGSATSVPLKTEKVSLVLFSQENYF